jgi:hypothetical protein
MFNKGIAALIFLGLVNILIFAQNRGVGVKVQNEQGQMQEIALYQASYALIIGASNYKDSSWNKLPGVKDDIPAVRKILQKHGFEVEELSDPTSANLLARINQFVNDYGLQAENRLLIYFAGHGYTETDASERKFGYIVPIDAPNPEKNPLEFQRKAVTMDDIENVARKIRSKHALFIFDSCFSGTLLFRSKPVVPPIITYYSAFSVRQFITSGAANQEVPDESVFRQMFVRGLEGESDFNKDGYITGTELATYLQEKVIYYRGESQTPQYGKIRDPKLDRGDFIFVLAKNSPGSNTLTTVNKPQTEVKPPVIFTPPRPPRGKKADKILFTLGIIDGNKLPSSDIFSISSEFRELLIARLKERNLTVLNNNNNADLTAEESSQYLGGINSRNDEKSLRLLPVALIFNVTISSLEDLPQYQGLFVSKVNGYIEVVDTADNKTISLERFSEVRGFGNTQTQARKNAFKLAAADISDSFLNLVKEKAK